MQKRYFAFALAVLVSLSACGDDAPDSNPTAPSPAEGVTLKVSAPALVAPVNGVRVADMRPTLAFGAATGSYAQGDFTYRVQVMNAANAVIYEQAVTALKTVCGADLEPDKDYSWRVRAELEGAAGPWSEAGRFKSPESVGFMRGREVYDPLTGGASLGSVGRVVGAHTWLPGEGIRLDTPDSYIEYALEETCSSCEFSMIVSNVGGDSGAIKSKIMSMREGLADLTSNDRRMTVEKRLDGKVAWRFITHDVQIDTGNLERVAPGIRDENTYLWTARWNGVFRVTIDKLPEYATIYNLGKAYPDVYDPTPHYAYVGSPQSGAGHGTVAGMVVRQVWLSPDPRPEWARQ